MSIDALTAADIWATVLESAKHSSLPPEHLAESLISAEATIRMAMQPQARTEAPESLSATELTDTIYQIVVEAVKATGERPYSLDEGCHRIGKALQISTLLQWLVRRQQDSLVSNSENR